MLLRYMIDWFQKKFFFILSINVTSFLIILQNGDQNIRWLIKRFDKGSHPLRKVQFFLTLFKRPLAPPPLSFEHLSYFAGGVF